MCLTTVGGKLNSYYDFAKCVIVVVSETSGSFSVDVSKSSPWLYWRCADELWGCGSVSFSL